MIHQMNVLPEMYESIVWGSRRHLCVFASRDVQVGDFICIEAPKEKLPKGVRGWFYVEVTAMTDVSPVDQTPALVGKQFASFEPVADLTKITLS